MHNGKKNIPFFNYPSLFNDHREELLDIFSEVSSRGAFIMQNELIEFETDLNVAICGSI